MTDAEFDQLCDDARLVVANMSAVALVHMRHMQRISFATGNVALSSGDVLRATIDASVRRVAGPCPCDDCLSMHTRQSRPTQPLSAEMSEALADACKETDT